MSKPMGKKQSKSASESVAKNVLLIIDPQNDFILPSGALSVKGAENDMKNLISFINRDDIKLTDIVATLDTHNPIHIASPCYWEDQSGNQPAPFTQITHSDLKARKWVAKHSVADSIRYMKELESKGKVHTIWPPHCLFATGGWGIYQELYNAIVEWVFRSGGNFEMYMKGLESEKTEMFSVVMPEVPMGAGDEENAEMFLSYLDDLDTLYIAGEAKDYCVLESVKHIFEFRPELQEKSVILTNCMSAIDPTNRGKNEYWNHLKKKGVRFL